MESVQVWAARLGTADEGIPGALSLQPPFLRFEADARSPEIDIELSKIRKVERGFGAPTIVVVYDKDDLRPAVAFYFVEPPPLPQAGMRRRRTRRQAVRKLGRESGVTAREKAKSWAEAIRKARAEAKRS
jgi:hypothetical protein